MRLGLPVTYHVEAGHHAGEHGSIHHPEQRRFAGLVTRVHDAEAGIVDLVFFPPGKEARHVERAVEGVGPGTWGHVRAHHLDEQKDAP